MPGPQVLIVDELPDTEEVLRAVLAPRGVDVRRIAPSETASPAPALVVIDAESEPAGRARFAGVPQIVLGRVSRVDAAACHVLPKPFQYAELVRAIEAVIVEGRGESNSRAS
jgi:DNA-binding response OmpR family regulator